MQRFLSYENTILAVVMRYLSSILLPAAPWRQPCLASVRLMVRLMLSSVGSLSCSWFLRPWPSCQSARLPTGLASVISFYSVSPCSVSLRWPFILWTPCTVCSCCASCRGWAVPVFSRPAWPSYPWSRRHSAAAGPWALRLPPYIAACPLGLSWAASFLIT